VTPRGALLALLCAGAACFAGCVVHTTHPYEASVQRAPASGPVPEIFQYTADARPIGDDRRPELDTQTHTARQLTWKSVGDNGQPDMHVIADYFQSVHPGRHPLVIVLPLWGTYTYPPQKIAEGIRDRGKGDTQVLRVLGESYLFDWDELAASPDPETLRARSAEMSEHMHVTVIDVRRLLDWAWAQPEIDPARIGIVGFSMSAVVAGLVLGADDRVQAAALVMGGADLHDIIANCNGPLQHVRDEVLPRFGWTQEQYHAMVEDTWGWLNPTHFPARIAASRIIMFDAGRDECMPQKARDDFWEALGQPRRVSFHYGHKKSFLALTPLGLNYMRRQIYRFLEATL
jgi:dienelactone hydrolase